MDAMASFYFLLINDIEYREAFRVQEYLHLETYDKQVMASLIANAKVMGEDRLEVAWKYGDIYEKILGEMQ